MARVKRKELKQSARDWQRLCIQAETEKDKLAQNIDTLVAEVNTLRQILISHGIRSNSNG